ncbi:hypothetical protein [Saccharopolyspora pogona]|uniref:hypothetical protein n=1 Tax=Saccharopolyspora pogona TaxID=333966 RepID=UPI001681D840|nr:hypothetical protein [Saccharopolyspora pogona]
MYWIVGRHMLLALVACLIALLLAVVLAPLLCSAPGRQGYAEECALTVWQLPRGDEAERRKADRYGRYALRS